MRDVCVAAARQLTLLALLGVLCKRGHAECLARWAAAEVEAFFLSLGVDVTSAVRNNAVDGKTLLRLDLPTDLAIDVINSDALHFRLDRSTDNAAPSITVLTRVHSPSWIGCMDACRTRMAEPRTEWTRALCENECTPRWYRAQGQSVPPFLASCTEMQYEATQVSHRPEKLSGTDAEALAPVFSVVSDRTAKNTASGQVLDYLSTAAVTIPWHNDTGSALVLPQHSHLSDVLRGQCWDSRYVRDLAGVGPDTDTEVELE